MPARFGARLHVMTVVPDFGLPIVGAFFPEDFEQKALAAADQQSHDFVAEHVPDNIEVRHIVAHGTVYEEILRVANDIGAELIMLASHRPELRGYLIGPNAARVVRHFEGSVLVIL